MYAFGNQREKRRSKGKQGVWLAPRLNKRVQILEPVQAEHSGGGLDQTYTTLTTIWAGVETVSHNSYRKWSSVEDFENISHEFIIRRNSVDYLHTEFGAGFSSGFVSAADLNPMKSNFYLLLQQPSSTKGRLFRIRRSMDVDEKREYISMLVEEVEEKGTGFPS